MIGLQRTEPAFSDYFKFDLLTLALLAVKMFNLLNEERKIRVKTIILMAWCRSRFADVKRTFNMC